MRDILVVTSFNERLYKQYGHRCIDSFKNWPSNAKLVVYAEEFVPPGDGFEVRDLHKSCPELVAYKEEWAKKDSVDWRWNATKFSNKVFAAAHAFRRHDGIGVWLDADCITYSQIPDGFLETLLPEGCCLSFLKRHSMYTETGFWMIDCNHQFAKPFLGAFEGMYLDGSIYWQPEWHDCVAFDISKNKFQERGMRTFNLTPREYPQLHPMSASALAPYIDHCKGQRKKLGYSPEYKNRAFEAKQKKVIVAERGRRWTKSDPVPDLPSELEIAELEGYRAYEDGVDEKDCPYKEAKYEQQWKAGWNRGYQEFLQEQSWA